MIIIAISSVELYIHCAQVLMLNELITCTCLILLNWRALRVHVAMNFVNFAFQKIMHRIQKIYVSHLIFDFDS